MRLLLSLPLGFLIGISLGALGGGGSILAVPVLVYAVGLDPKAATTTSLVVVGAASLGGMVGHLRAGRVRPLAGTLFGVAGIGGSILGSHLNESVNPEVLLLGFAGVMVVAAWRMWASQRAGGPARQPAARALPGGRRGPRAPGQVGPSTVAKVLVAGTVVGFMTGFFGVGGGFIVVPALVLALGYEMPVAVGTSLLVIAVNSAVALVSRITTVGVVWHVALPFALAAVLGAALGNRLAGRVPAASLVRWFVMLLLAVAAYTAVRSALAL